MRYRTPSPACRPRFDSLCPAGTNQRDEFRVELRRGPSGESQLVAPLLPTARGQGGHGVQSVGDAERPRARRHGGNPPGVEHQPRELSRHEAVRVHPAARPDGAVGPRTRRQEEGGVGFAQSRAFATRREAEEEGGEGVQTVGTRQGVHRSAEEQQGVRIGSYVVGVGR
jgi:hypothetical protein